MFPTLKLLAVALDARELARIAQVLASGGVRAELVVAEKGKVAGVAAGVGHLDAALVPFTPETGRTLELAREVRGAVATVPLLLLCGAISGAEAVAAVRTGVAECIALTQLDSLASLLLRVMDEALAAGNVEGPPLGQLLDGAPEAILMVDPERRIRVFNRQAQRMFQCSVVDALGQPLETFLTPLRLPCDRGTAPAGPLEPLCGNRPGGTSFPAEASVAAVTHAARCWCAIVVRDISEQRRLEDQLRFAQKMEVFGQLAGGIAHDFNNILTVMMSLTDDMLGQLPKEHDLRWNAEELREASSRAAALTRQLLVFSRRQAIHPSRILMNKVVEDSQKLLRRSVRESVQFAVELDALAGVVEVDVGQLEQVLLNLVLNASDAMPRGGHIKMSTQRVELRQPLGDALGSLPAGVYVRLCVEDDGVGMPPEVLLRVFEPFFTTRAVGKGSGLGLSVCLGIIKQAGGHIVLESQPGKGTRAVVHLPEARPVGEMPSAHDPAGGLRGHETLLVVEDEPVVQKLVQRSLSALGYAVRVARDPAHALELLAADEDIGLLLTDVVMPDMGGPALALRARAQRPHLPVLFMTGYLDDESQGQMKDVSGSQLLAKPFSQQQLAERIRAMLDGTDA